MLNDTTIGDISLKCSVIKPKVLQNFILIHVTTLSTNEKTGNYQILSDVVRFAKNISI